jgi:hypothetical protein
MLSAGYAIVFSSMFDTHYPPVGRWKNSRFAFARTRPIDNRFVASDR